MTILGAIGGAFSAATFIIIGALLRLILRSHGGQLFHGAFLIGDIAFWIALFFILVGAFVGFISDAAIFGGTRGRRF